LEGREGPRRKQAAPPKEVAKRRRRTAGGKTLMDTIKDVLAASGKPMTPKDIVKAVMKAGYKSRAKDFYGMVAKALLTEDAFKRVKRGVYTLA